MFLILNIFEKDDKTKGKIKVISKMSFTNFSLKLFVESLDAQISFT